MLLILLGIVLGFGMTYCFLKPKSKKSKRVRSRTSNKVIYKEQESLRREMRQHHEFTFSGE